MSLLPITHTLEVKTVRRVPCLTHPGIFQPKRAKPGVQYHLSLRDDHYVITEMTKNEVDPATGEEAEVRYGWLKDDLEKWSHLDSGNECYIVLNEQKANAA